MKNVLTLCTMVLLCLFEMKAQDCFSNAGEDSFSCTFQDTLIGSPAGGEWLIVCTDSTGAVSFETLSDSSTIVTFSECGIYLFEYLISTDSCTATDTVQVDFENPSNANYLVGLEVELDYLDYTCQEDDSLSCENFYQIEGMAPIPYWEFTPFGSCVSQLYSASVGNMLDSCTADSISINMMNHAGVHAPSDSLVFSQDDFITLDNDEVIENNFLDIINSTYTYGKVLMEDECPSPMMCGLIPLECMDTLLDTVVMIVPIHLGGHWTFLHNGNFIDLDINNTFTVDTLDYFLSVMPSPDIYNSSFEIFELEASGDTIFPSQTIGLTLLWEEDWILDTLRRVDTLICPKDSCCTGGVKIQRQGFLMPPIPEYNCAPFTITFFPDLLASEPNIICHDSTYIVEVSLSGGIPPYFSSSQGGMLNNNIFTSDTIPVDVSDFSFEFVDSGSCETTVTGDNCTCLWGDDLASFELIITEDCGIDSLGTLFVNHLVGGFPTFQYSLDSLNWQTEPFFDSLSAGNYSLYVQDSFMCVIELPFIVAPKEILLTADWNEELEICGNEERQLEIPLSQIGEEYYSVEWENGDTTKNRIINKGGRYYANITLLVTCAQFTIVYEVEDISSFSERDVRLPNAFTPNGDNINDDFNPIVNDNYIEYKSYSLNVFNRWGQPVFQSKNPLERWNPEIKNATDVYVWFLEMEVETCDGRLIPYKKSGDLTLIR